MKKIFLLAIFILALTGCNDPQPLNVKGIKTDLTSYQKEGIIIEGIVSTWQGNDPQLFAIADMTEKEKLTQFLLPVRFEGTKPKAGDVVRVTGKVDLVKKMVIAKKVQIMQP